MDTTSEPNDSGSSTSLTWRGHSIKSIYNDLGMFDRQNQAPPVEPSDNHTVLFSMPLPTELIELPAPTVAEDKWDSLHVRMPNSPSSRYFEINADGLKEEKIRWQLIEKSLTEKVIKSSRELEEAIKKYNTKFAEQWNFVSLHELFENVFSESDTEFFFDNVMPKIIELALKLPEIIQAPIPFLTQLSNQSISMSQQQAACLLANAFLCTFPRRNGGRKNTDYPEINFNRIFSINAENVVEKIKCICNYFKRVCNSPPTGVLTYQRRYIDPQTFPKWDESELNFLNTKLLVSSHGTIEDSTAMLQVDFANRYLGGGVLGWGCVQEEIRFVINPELIVGLLFCESMRADEAIVMTGCEQFNKYSGYASTFEWGGNYQDETLTDDFRRRMIYVVAIDAISFSSKPHLQFEGFTLKREVNKAFTGFYHDPLDERSPIPVSSGNWGCGAFRGYKQLKALLQLIACCANRRNLIYYTFDDKELMDEIHEMFTFLTENKVTVGQIWKYLNMVKQHKLANRPDKLYPFIYQMHKDSEACNELLDGFDVISEEFSEAELSDKRKFDDIENENTDNDLIQNDVNELAVETAANPPKKPKISESSSDEILEKAIKGLNAKYRDESSVEQMDSQEGSLVEKTNSIAEEEEAINETDATLETFVTKIDSQESSELMEVVVEKSHETKEQETTQKATQNKITDFFKRS